MKTLPKTRSLLLASLAACLSFAPQLTYAGEGASSGGGGDKVEPLFISAKNSAISIVNRIELSNVNKLAIPAFYKNWLKTRDNLVKLQFFVTSMELSFQDNPCIEDGNPRGTCFDNSNPDQPRMVVSYSYNQNTTPAQAQALVIHEAGHFIGEMNHAFLSGLGHELMAHPVRKPTGLVSTKSDGAIVQNPDGSITVTRPVFWDAGSKKWLPIAVSELQATSMGLCKQLGMSHALYYQGDERLNWEGTPKGTESVVLDNSGRLQKISLVIQFYNMVTCSN